LQSVFLFSKKFKEKNIFFWGIRSSILTDGHYNNRNFFKLLKLYKLRKSIKKFNVLFFISNELIKNEFLDLGFLRKELILRPERTIKKLKIIEKKGSHFSLLSIGTIRKDKNIIFASKAAYKTKTNLIIAGRSSDDTARKWDKKISDRYWQYVKRINRFLDEDEYFNLVENTNYILITSLRTNSVRSNGTFIEAILYSTPVILPNYPPFDYYNKKYNVGLLYNSGDEDSLIEAIERAKKIKYEYFIPGIKKFQKDMLLENVAKKVKKQLTNI
jgi:glycosyltransferase involved in cell wall biosynthesis